MLRKSVLLAGVLLVPQAPAAQTPTFRSGVELVEVAVIVRDRDGRFVPDLSQRDFELSEKGVPQEIEAFDLVSLPAPPPAAAASRGAAPPPDVASNERAAESRVYLLVLDALHVDARRTRVVREQARRFIEDHVAAADLVAVVSPGALASATQDFTSDRARLLAAVEHFAGSKLRSASLGIEEERQAGLRGGMAIHQGMDPDDFERSGRAASLTETLESLARHLATVPRRRKALLLFSEGIEYNQLDTQQRQQRYASDVTKATSRAVAALMRANVVLYAIDPRGSSSAEGDLVETSTYQLPRGQQPALTGSVDQEYSDSLRSLRDVSDATGGYAVVDTNSFDSAFERIVEESSRYYVLGYAPAKPMKPGEYREIDVRVARAGVSVVARKGHGAASPTPRAAAPAPAPEAVPPTFAGRPGRPGPAVSLPADSSAPARTTRGLAGDLQLLLASPLPRAGLPLRLQAIPSAGDAKNGSVQLVVEVLGGGLQFEERGGRFEERIDLALLTMDARAKADNGRSTSLDLRLTPEERQRVATTGVRWLSRLELKPGRYQVRVAGRAARSGATGMVSADVDVPALSDRAALGGVALTSLTAVLMPTRGDAKPGTALPTPPSAARAFVAGDHLTAAVDVHVPAAAPALELSAHVEWPDGSRNPPLKRTLAPGQARPRTDEVTLPIDTSLLAPGRYVLRIVLKAGVAGAADRALGFEITTPASR